MGACQEIHEQLMGYLDKELDADLRDQVEAHLAECTECTREVAIYQNLKRLTARLRLEEPEAGKWGAFLWKINRRLVRGTGWSIFLAGCLIYVTYGLYHFITDPSVETVYKLAGLGVLVGVFLLLISVAYERWQVWKTDPYKEVRH